MTTANQTDWLGIAQRLQALAQAGLDYAPNAFDAERYEEVQALSLRLMAGLTGEPVAQLDSLFAGETGYPTPKVDIRAVLFRGTDEVLLAQEKMDGNRWSLPGGWADVGYTPFEVAVKEVGEETGLTTEAVRLLALLDKKQHAHRSPGTCTRRLCSTAWSGASCKPTRWKRRACAGCTARNCPRWPCPRTG